MKLTLALLTLSIFLSASPARSQSVTADPTVHSVTLEGKDAEALYERLERKEFVGDGYKKALTKVGQNVLCTKEKSGLFDHKYKCAFSFKLPSGELHEMYPIGETDTNAGLKEPKAYSGDSIEIKEKSTDAIYTIRGSDAETLSRAMKGEEADARIDEKGTFAPLQKGENEASDQNGTTVKSKTGVHLRCFTTLATISPITECVVTLETKPGKAKKANETSQESNKNKLDMLDPAEVKKAVTPAPAVVDPATPPQEGTENPDQHKQP